MNQYYEMKLSEAGKFFEETTEPLISLKIRPTDDESYEITWQNSYVYEYDEIYAAFQAMELQEEKSGFVSREKATLYRLPSGDIFLFVEHETGPELIFQWSQWFSANKDILVGMGATIGIIKGLAPVLKKILQILSKSVEDKRQGEGKRYYDAKQVKIEVRTEKNASVILNLHLPVSADAISEKNCINYIIQIEQTAGTTQQNSHEADETINDGCV